MTDTKKKPPPTWHMKITSSNIEEAWYRPATEQLRIRFKGDNVYTYLEVSLQEFHDFSVAPSQGVFFSKHIKDIKPVKKAEG